MKKIGKNIIIVKKIKKRKYFLYMLIVNVDNKVPIEKALKLFKSKVIKTKLMSELKSRKEFEKKSIKRRNQLNKAKFVEKFKKNED